MSTISLQGRRRFPAAVDRALAASTEHAEPFIVTAALLAVFGHPLFYLIWKYLIPQPYESLGLRLLASAVCLPLVFKNRWPARARWLLRYYWHLAVLFTLPFFFSLYLFLNGFSQVWVLSTIGATFLLTFIVTWHLAGVLFVLGTGAAYGLVLWLGMGVTVTPSLLEIIVVYLFVLFVGGAINMRLQRYRERQAEFEKRLRVLSAQHAMTMREHNDLLSRFLNNIIINRLRAFQNRFGLGRALELITQQEKRFCGIMQADIRNFTRMFDADTELKVAQLISQCFSETTHIGQDLAVVKPIGDCVFIYSDGGNDREDAALNIFALAVFFVHSVAKVNRMLGQTSVAPLNFGIAVHAGEVIYGNLASDTMIDPTVIGLNVNKTARMEELTKSPAVRERVGANAVVMSDEIAELIQARLGGLDGLVQLSLDELNVSIRDFPTVRTVCALPGPAAEALHPLALDHIRSRRMARAPGFETAERNVHLGVEYYYEMAGSGPNTTWAIYINVSDFPADTVEELVTLHFRHLESRLSHGQEQWLALSTERFPGEFDEAEVEGWIIDLIERLSASQPAHTAEDGQRRPGA